MAPVSPSHARCVLPICLLTLAVLCLTAFRTFFQLGGGSLSRYAITDKQALSALEAAGAQIKDLSSPHCKVRTYGNGWGGHNLCEITMGSNGACTFWSFGVSTDYSFDVDLAQARCSGFSFDPSVTLNSTLSDGVIFFQLAANMFTEEEKVPKYTYASLPKLMDALKLDHIDILKLDCEGCEFALAADIAASGRNIFYDMQQVTIELHVSDAFLHSRAHVIQLGKLFHILNDSNMRLESVDLQGLDTMETGCSKLQDTGYPCEKGLCAHNLLFAKAPFVSY